MRPTPRVSESCAKKRLQQQPKERRARSAPRSVEELKKRRGCGAWYLKPEAQSFWGALSELDTRNAKQRATTRTARGSTRVVFNREAHSILADSSQRPLRRNPVFHSRPVP